jgi:hypothetical protein
MRRLFLPLAVSLALLALGLFLLGQPLSSSVASAPSTARVRVVHAVSDAPPVDIAINGVIEAPSLAFKEVTPYIDVPAGTFTLTVIAPGPVPILTMTRTAEAGYDYTVVAHGLLTSVDTPPTLLVVTDDNSVPPVGKARARFYHLVPDAPPADVAIQGGAILLSDVTYGEASPYVEIDMGTYDLELRTVVMGFPMTVPVPPVTADPNTIYSFFAVGTLSPLDVDIVPVQDAQYARVRAFHGVSDAPPVDVWLNGTKAFDGVAYKDLTPYGAVMSDTYTLGLAPAGVPIPVLTRTLVLTGGMDFTVAAAGTLTVTDSHEAELLPYVDDNTLPLPGKAHVRLIHLVPDAPPVNVGVTGVLTPLFTAVMYRQATSYAPVDEGLVDLEVSIAGVPGMPVVTLPNVVFEDGTIQTGFAVGLVVGPAPVEVVGLTQRFTVYLPLVAKSP